MPIEPQWPKGKQSTYDAFVIEVGVRKDHTGEWRSYRRLQGAQDFTVAEKMGPSGGMEEATFALLFETVRSEAMLQLLVMLSSDPNLQGKIISAQNAPEELIEKLCAVTLKQLKLSLDKVIPGIVREAVEQVHDELRNETSG